MCLLDSIVFRFTPVMNFGREKQCCDFVEIMPVVIQIMSDIIQKESHIKLTACDSLVNQ